MTGAGPLTTPGPEVLYHTAPLRKSRRRRRRPVGSGTDPDADEIFAYFRAGACRRDGGPARTSVWQHPGSSCHRCTNSARALVVFGRRHGANMTPRLRAPGASRLRNLRSAPVLNGVRLFGLRRCGSRPAPAPACRRAYFVGF